MKTAWKRLGALALAGIFPLLSASSGASSAGVDMSPRLEAFVEPFEPSKIEELRFPTFTAQGKRLKPSRWRVVSGTGNERENYLAATESGMLLDFGGSWLRFSTNEGRTWSQVLPAPELRELYNYEGTVAVAPGGDIVASAQDWPPGVAMTFKYEAEDKQWFYGWAKLNTPLMDRPSIGIVPGPFTISGSQVPYISVLRGGFYFSKSPWFYSLDGLNYSLPTNKLATSLATTPAAPTEPLETEKWDELDWIQSYEQIGISPYGRGKAIADRPSFVGLGRSDPTGHAPRSIFDPTTLQWHAYEYPAGGPPPNGPKPDDPLLIEDIGRTVADSAGNLHHVLATESSIKYMLSGDGGKTWTTRDIPLLPGYRIDGPTGYWRTFKASGSEATSMLVVHAVKQDPNETVDAEDAPLATRELVYRFSFRDGVPKVTKVHVLGEGGFGCLFVGSASSRLVDGICDFPSAALLPGGRAVVSFTDSAHQQPAVAIEL